MVQSVELLLNPELDDWVWQQWRALESAGLPSQVKHGSLTNWPHVTLGVADRISADIERRLAGAVQDLPIKANLGGVIWFPGKRHVVARAVVPSPELLDIHAQIAAILDGLPGTGRRMSPGTWSPHVTLARGIKTEQLGEVMSCLSQIPGMSDELPGEFLVARRWDSDARVTWEL